MPKPPLKGTLETLSGEEIELPHLQDKWLVITRWASWCPTCKMQIGTLNRLDIEHPDVQVFGYNTEYLSRKALKKKLKKLNIKFKSIITNPESALSLPRTRVVPVTYIIAPHGQLKKVFYGSKPYQHYMDIIKP